MLRSIRVLGALVACVVLAGGCPGNDVSLSSGSQSAAVDALFADYDRPDSPGCALGVIQDGEFVYRAGYGMADLERGVPLDPDSVFRIGSTSKQFTAMTVLLLQESGVLNLDDRIVRWLPELTDLGDAITIAQLLHHTSGMRDYLVLADLAGYRPLDYYDAPELLGLLARQRDLNFPPGSEFLYSNSGYFLLSQIVQRASRRTLADLAHELIFAPLGMTATHYHDDPTVLVPHRALGYSPSETGFVLDMTPLPIVGDGGVFTSVNDLLAWDRNYYDNRLGQGGPELITLWQQRGRLNDGTELPYAAGIVNQSYRGLPMLAHGGSFVGYRAEMLRFPEQRFGVVTLCNVSSAEPSRLARRVADLYLGDSMQAPEPGSPEISVSPPPPATELLPVSELRHYAGRYHSAELDAVYEIRVQDGQLTWSMPFRWRRELQALESDRFVVADDPDVIFRFGRNARGQVTGLMVDAGRVVNLWFDRTGW